ncbi:MAG: hypothetical protein KBB37_00315 [Bacteroidia bacterium]|nr:hypothetical protein [Bacteroidia bacterium]MBP7259702.1 hypothetical protein [Bacteroidia bacterium]MBP9179399.1 hypothetical protein [Bacteroidia bacterium]MBP9723347.1 hypothetical protein [Bacteroidia bacterium]
MIDPSYEIQPEDELLRKVPTKNQNADGNDYIKILPDGRKAITRLAFRPDPVRDINGLSTSIIQLVQSIELLYNQQSHLGVFVTKNQCDGLGLSCVHAPESANFEDIGFAHALILGLMGRKDLQATLADICIII